MAEAYQVAGDPQGRPGGDVRWGLRRGTRSGDAAAGARLRAGAFDFQGGNFPRGRHCALARRRRPAGLGPCARAGMLRALAEAAPGRASARLFGARPRPEPRGELAVSPTNRPPTRPVGCSASWPAPWPTATVPLPSGRRSPLGRPLARRPAGHRGGRSRRLDRPLINPDRQSSAIVRRRRSLPDRKPAQTHRRCDRPAAPGPARLNLTPTISHPESPGTSVTASRGYRYPGDSLSWPAAPIIALIELEPLS